MKELLSSRITVLKSFKNANIMDVNGKNVLIVSATGPFIPMREFKQIFEYTGELVKQKAITKLIFDKRELDVFNQPSMEWYFVSWKEQMYEFGLRTHRKILPKDEMFRESVKIGREQINEQYPAGKFHLMDINYCEGLDEALAR